MALLETKEVDYYYQDGDQRRLYFERNIGGV